MRPSRKTEPLTRLRGRRVVMVSDAELNHLRQADIGDCSAIQAADAHHGHHIWLCHGVDRQARRIDWICAAVVRSCAHESPEHRVTVMLLTRPQTNTSF